MKLTLDAPTTKFALPLSAAATIPFTPDRFEAREGAPVYRVRVPTFRTRAALETATMPIQMRIPSDAQMNDAAIAAATALCKPDQRDACLEILGSFGAFLENPERMKDKADEAKALADEARNIANQLTPFWPSLSEMFSERVQALAIIRYLTARHYIAGFENVTTIKGEPLTFKTGPDGLIAEEVVQFLPPADINAVAAFAQDLMAPSEDLTKN